MGKKLGGAAITLVVVAIVVCGVFNIRPIGPWVRKYFYSAKGAVAGVGNVASNSKSPELAAACRANLQLIESIKAKIRDTGARATGAVSWPEIMKEANLQQRQLICPGGGTYELGLMTQAARCSIGGNGTTDALDDHLIKSY